MDYLTQLCDISNKNKYTMWYSLIIKRAQTRAKTKKEAKMVLGYTETHHILPKSFNLGGETDILNYVYLSPREHFICHLLLTKMLTGEFKVKMCFALHSMRRIINRNKKLKISSWEYRKIKEANIFARKNSVGPFLGNKHTKETIEKIKEHAYRGNAGKIAWNKGLSFTEEHIKNHREGILQYREKNPNWKEQLYSARKIGEEKRLDSICKKTSIDGIIYKSATEAATILGLKKTTLIKRILSKNFPNYNYVKGTQ